MRSWSLRSWSGLRGGGNDRSVTGARAVLARVRGPRRFRGGQRGEDAGGVLGVEELLLGLREGAGDVSIPVVEVAVLALAADADVVVARSLLVRVPPAQRRAADRGATLRWGR